MTKPTIDEILQAVYGAGGKAYVIRQYLSTVAKYEEI
jgi:hypothetical protein